MKLSQPVLDVLCCPVCRASLRVVGEEFHCTDVQCGRRFPSVDGVPILVNEARSVFTIDSFLNREQTFFRSRGRFRRLVGDCLPTLSHNTAARRVLPKVHERLLQRSDRPRLLVIGAGGGGVGVSAILEDPRIEVVESDVSFGARVQVICDAHDLPFADSSFDGVIVQAVLEHVLDPGQCVEEIHRVLKLGGLVYAETPFVCPVHARQYDFTRFTRLGHRRLFRRFGEVESGMAGGPGSTLGWTMRYFVMSFFTTHKVRAVISGLCRLGFFWFKYFDYLLKNKEPALDSAFGFYFFGEKREDVFSDHDLLRSYRGGVTVS